MSHFSPETAVEIAVKVNYRDSTKHVV